MIDKNDCLNKLLDGLIKIITDFRQDFYYRAAFTDEELYHLLGKVYKRSGYVDNYLYMRGAAKINSGSVFYDILDIDVKNNSAFVKGRRVDRIDLEEELISYELVEDKVAFINILEKSFANIIDELRKSYRL